MCNECDIRGKVEKNNKGDPNIGFSKPEEQCNDGNKPKIENTRRQTKRLYPPLIKNPSAPTYGASHPLHFQRWESSVSIKNPWVACRQSKDAIGMPVFQT